MGVGYALGIDLGTTFSAAAVHRGDRVEIVQLGTHGAAVPSVVVLRADNTVLTGEAAERRAATEPDRVAREFKRRLGDTTPLILGGSPQSVDSVMARMLRAVVDQVAEREGGPADHVAVTHPANWGEYKLDLLRQAVRMAGLPPVTFVSEPEAAAVHYSSHERIPEGATIAVYDLGGGTFDTVILRKVGDGFQILGEPEGIERLGGVDFDAAVIAHVRSHVGEAMDRVAPGDAAAARLRTECVHAKEALSQDLDVTIPVLLPDHHGEVVLTRAEFEHAIRPALGDTVDALRRALAGAGVTADQLHAVLLVGGSSRIPLVAEIVGNELGRPVAVDAHPKHVVALGAAAVANRQATETPPVADLPPPTEPDTAPDGSATAPDPDPAPRRKLRPLVVLVAIAIIAAGAAGAFFVFSSGDDPGTDTAAADEDTADDTEESTTTSTSSTSTSTTTTEAAEEQTTTTSTTTTTTTVPPEPDLPDPNCNGGLCIEIDEIALVGGELEVQWTPEGFEPSTAATHAHFYWDVYESSQVGAGAANQAPWELTDQRPFVPTGEMRITNRPAHATGVCVTVANGGHAVVDPANFHCVPIPDA